MWYLELDPSGKRSSGGANEPWILGVYEEMTGVQMAPVQMRMLVTCSSNAHLPWSCPCS
jgi:hypothetical protein